ncbi:MAG: hypothetical protein Q7J57_13345, partial [Gemmobacter sp.]|nr:hypothetical protein [Gemmobacter sp.]
HRRCILFGIDRRDGLETDPRWRGSGVMTDVHVPRWGGQALKGALALTILDGTPSYMRIDTALCVALGSCLSELR